MKNISLAFFCLIITIGYSQSTIDKKFNLDFEVQKEKDSLPLGWSVSGDYDVRIDSKNVVSGKNAIVIDGGNGQSYSVVGYNLPVNFKGKKITLEGFIKIENATDGFVGLLMQIDKDNIGVSSGNMENAGLQGTIDWKKYSITIDFVENADELLIGAIFVGKGKAWFDNFKVSIDGKEISTLKQVPKVLSEIEKDVEFNNGSKFELTTLNTTQSRNLFILGKVWGFLKYHHPTIAEGKISWDYELFRMLQKIDSKKFDSELVTMIKKLGDFKTEKYLLPKAENIKLFPRTEWIKDTTILSEELSQVLQKVQSAKRTEKNYYIDFNPKVKNPEFKSEKMYLNMQYTDSGLKLLALFRYWNMIEYFFPNRHLIDENWDTVLQETIPKIIQGSDGVSYKLQLLKLIGKIQDTHARISNYDKDLDHYFGSNSVPIEVTFVENKLVVTKLYEEFEDDNLKVGDIITHINGESVESWVNRNSDYFPASNYPTKLRNMTSKILRTNDDKLNITVASDLKTSTINFSTVAKKYWEVQTDSHKIINSDIGYIYPGTLKKGEINSIMEQFLDKKGLIIDFRCYPSDFVVYSISNYLLKEPKTFVEFTHGSIINPGTFFYGEKASVGDVNKDFYKGKVVILVNEQTQSQAEYSVMAFRLAENAIVIGSTTAGADGNISSIVFPGSVYSFISGIGVLNPDRSETQRVGIIPDIVIKPTIKGIKDGKDELLEKAIDLINQ